MLSQEYSGHEKNIICLEERDSGLLTKIVKWSMIPYLKFICNFAFVIDFLTWIWHYVRSCDESFPEALQKIWRPTNSTLTGGG